MTWPPRKDPIEAAADAVAAAIEERLAELSVQRREVERMGRSLAEKLRDKGVQGER